MSSLQTATSMAIKQPVSDHKVTDVTGTNRPGVSSGTSRKTIVLKLTGEIIQHTSAGLDATLLEDIARQIKLLRATHQFGIVMGGGNFFRGAQHGTEISAQVGHYVGMLATMMNGLIIQDIFERAGISTALFSAITCEEVGFSLSPQNIANGLHDKDCLIFAAGTGNPFFTTDTTAVLRTLQLNADELWKGTKVDGVYLTDPQKDPSAQIVKRLTYHEALAKRLQVMDLSAFALAEQYKVRTRVFNIFTKDALLQAATIPTFGSTIVENINLTD